MTDNIVVLRLPQGQTRLRGKKEGMRQRKGKVEIYRGARGTHGYIMEGEQG